MSRLHLSRIAGITAAGSIAALLLSACAPTDVGMNTISSTDAPAAQTADRDTVTGVLDAFDITSLCGDKDITIGFAASNSSLWTREALALMQREADKCPHIAPIVFTDSQGDPQKAIADVNSLVAQGVDAIVTLPTNGEAQLPSFRSAVQAGVPVVTFIGDPGGTAGVDVTDKVGQDFDLIGAKWAAWLDKTVGSGQVVFLGGTPGAPSSASFFQGLSGALKAYPKLTLVSDAVVDTNWDSATKKRTMAALLAQHGRIDAVLSDAGFSDRGALDAYTDAGMALPALASVAGSNEMGCYQREAGFSWLSIEGTQALGVVALRKAVAAVTGADDTEAVKIGLPVAIDSTDEALAPPCDPAEPADADLTTTLSAADLKAAN